MTALLGSPTVAALAAAIEQHTGGEVSDQELDDLVHELEGLSDDQAVALLAEAAEKST